MTVPVAMPPVPACPDWLAARFPELTVAGYRLVATEVWFDDLSFNFEAMSDRLDRELAIEAEARQDDEAFCRELTEIEESANAIARRAGVDPTWPRIDGAAYHGLVGEVVRTIGPQTEGDPIAVAVNFIVMVGNAIGATPFTPVGSARHGTNVFVVNAGETAKARKGTAYTEVHSVVASADPEWAATRIVGGMSSGEGLIYPLRDSVSTLKNGEEVVVDPGTDDHRLLAVEEEFSSVLKQSARQGNTLSEVIRRAWDRTTLQTLTRNSPLRASNPHVSILGHITAAELRRTLTETDAANGLANRFLWVCVRRSKLLPEGGFVDPTDKQRLIERTKRAIDFARRCGEVRRDSEARALWEKTYPTISRGAPGLFGAVTARAEAQVLRLSLIYALLDQSPEIRAGHLWAALALWEYCEQSARHIFGDATGDPVADRILTALKQDGPLDGTMISGLFDRHANAQRISQARDTLVSAGLVEVDQVPTGGRPRLVWRAA